MKTDQAKQLTNQAIEQLAAALKEGRSETITRYLATMARFHRYSLTNTLLIFGQRPTATHVAGVHTWLSLKRLPIIGCPERSSERREHRTPKF